MVVETNIEEIELETDDGRPIDGLTVTCTRCGHSVEVFGTSDASARRGAVMLREDCTRGENNFYSVHWSSE